MICKHGKTVLQHAKKKIYLYQQNKLSVDLGNFIADNLRSLPIKE